MLLVVLGTVGKGIPLPGRTAAAAAGRDARASEGVVVVVACSSVAVVLCQRTQTVNQNWVAEKVHKRCRKICAC